MTTPRQIQVLVLFLFLSIGSFWIAGCKTYKWSAKPPVNLSEIMEPGDKPVNIYMTTPGMQAFWLITPGTVDQEKLYGKVVSREEKPPYPVGTQEQRLSRRNIRLIVTTPKLDSLLTSESFEIPLSDISRIEEYQFDEAGTMILTLVAILAVPAIIFIVIMIAKGTSCPFVYSGAGDNAVFEGEIFSGATRPNMERDDWLPLRHLSPKNGQYQIRITNEVKEIQHTDLAELMLVDHPIETKVLFDKYGKVHTITEEQLPLMAVDRNSKDVLPFIQSRDSLRFMTSDVEGTADGLEWVDLTFLRPVKADQAKLIIRAKNNMWLDLAYSLFVDEQGVYAQRIKEEGLKKTKSEGEAWMLDQYIPLAVLLETSPGEFTQVDWFNLAGPMALREDILLLDLSEVQGDQIRIRLQAGFMFWELDHIAIDYQPDKEVLVQTLPAVEAKDQHGLSQREALRADDGLYYDQPEIGDAVTLTFDVPDLNSGLIRSAFLHARGHYEILREPSRRRPSKSYLAKFRERGRFTRFALEQYQLLNQRGYSFSSSLSR